MIGYLQHRQILVSTVTVLTAFLAGCNLSEDRAGQDTVTVLAAASTADALAEIAQLFERETHVEVEVSNGSSNGLAQQIIAGAPADVFLSANRQWATAIETEGLVTANVDLLANRMVLIVPKGNPAGIKVPEDLISARVGRVAIAGKNVPAGIYAEQALQNLKLFDHLENSKRLVRGSNVRVTLAYVEHAEADVGIVYATDALIAQDSVEVASQLDPLLYERIVYPAVMLQRASDQSGARRFFKFLRSSEARAIFERHGFTPLPSEQFAES